MATVNVNASFDTRHSTLDIPSAPTIRILSPETRARIAAGEVIERPSSVVKELAENALDAGAHRIFVDIASGGVDLIRVSDDGLGMNEADLSLCILEHATSKLASAGDLAALNSLGFRGEALPSIASVSHFSITTRARGMDAALILQSDGGVPLMPLVRPAAGPFGTSVEVRDLFFNLPARKKFLKGHASESAACAETLLRLALTRPDVGFTLTQERREVFAVSPVVENSKLKTQNSKLPSEPLQAAPFYRRARELLGRANTEHLMELDAVGCRSEELKAASPAMAALPQSVLALPEIPRGYRLFGLLSPPAFTRPNRAAIYLSVNGRPVKDRTLTSALLEAYRQLLPPKRYPVAVLFLELPSMDVDHNVHPAKTEVRFRVPGLVYALLHHAVRQGLGGVSSGVSNGECRMSNGVQQQWPVASGQGSGTAAESAAAYGVAPKAHVPHIPHIPLGAPQPDQGQRRFDLWPTVAPPNSAAAPQNPPQPAIRNSAFDIRHSPAAAPQNAPLAESIRHSTLDIQHSPAPFRVLGQAGGSYIVLEDDSGVKLIDQHALHERVLFELFLKKARDAARGDSQGLLTPVVLELTPVQSSAYLEGDTAAELLAHLGFETASFGERSIAVRAIPSIFKSAEKAALVLDVLDAITDTADDDPGRSGMKTRFSLREKACYRLACKAALKAGERLTIDQMSALVEDYRRLAGSHGFTCPHGRPVALELGWEQLERAVGR